ncbi:sugar phosphate isomerase/epimerase family protein [Kineococcus sp. NUM-3379]
MMVHGNTVADGTPVQEASAEQWAEVLDVMVDAGYENIDPTDTWIQIADLSPARLEEFARTVTAAGLGIPAFSTSRRSVLDPVHAAENLAYSHRAIDACAALGIPLISFGFFESLTEEQKKALWFWHEPNAPLDLGRENRARAVSLIQELARHAAEVGVQVSLEMYEDTFLYEADSTVRFVEEVGLDNVGLNPDFGNFVRLHRPIEDWNVVAEKTLPLANYWHIKNYVRDFDPATGAYFTHPAPLESGTVNYRRIIRYAVDHGFRGAFCVEHYGGDSISVGATNREYIRRVLPRTIPAL